MSQTAWKDLTDNSESTLEDLPGRLELPATTTGRLCPAALILDCSSSMQGPPISELNDAAARLERDLHADEIARNRVDIQIIEVRSSAKVQSPRCLARDFKVRHMSAHGTTALGAGINLAIDEIAARQDEYVKLGVKNEMAMTFALTDGFATDSVERAAKRVRELESKGRLAFYAVGTSTADMGALAEICAPDRPPLRMKDGHFGDLFEFISASLIAFASKPADAAQAPAPPIGWAQLGS